MLQLLISDQAARDYFLYWSRGTFHQSMYKVPKWYQWYTYVSTFSELFNNINPVDELMLVIDHLDDRWLPDKQLIHDPLIHLMIWNSIYYLKYNHTYMEIFIIMQYATYLICVWYQMIYHTLYVCSRMYSSMTQLALFQPSWKSFLLYLKDMSMVSTLLTIVWVKISSLPVW